MQNSVRSMLTLHPSLELLHLNQQDLVHLYELFIYVCLWLCTIVVHNTALNRQSSQLRWRLLEGGGQRFTETLWSITAVFTVITSLVYVLLKLATDLWVEVTVPYRYSTMHTPWVRGGFRISQRGRGGRCRAPSRVQERQRATERLLSIFVQKNSQKLRI